MNARSIVKLIIALLLIVIIYFQYPSIMLPKSIDIMQDKFDDKGNIELNLHEKLIRDVKVEFCPSNKCYDIYSQSLGAAKEEIKCAFYEFDIKNLSEVLVEKANQNVSIKLVIDNDYLEEKGLELIKNNSKIQIHSDIANSKYMHDKFCVIDSQILLTGSANPTENGFFKNNNNIIKIQSNYLSKNYENEFDQLFGLNFGYTKSSTLEYNNITLEYNNKSYVVSSYFCPQDNCPKEIIKVLSKAQKEIQFAEFSFTYDDFSEILVNKSSQGVNVSGILESRMRNIKGSDYLKLNSSGKVYLDTNKNTMHHKLFIVDEKYVITGSMNPSQNAAKYNDENILIINNEELAKQYKAEIISLYS